MNLSATPDLEAIYARAFRYAIQMGWLPQGQIDEAKEAGRCELRADRIKERLASDTQPCAGCGEPSHGHWCSDACRIAEDGPQPDEIPEEATT